jgi:alpha-L-fucosidase
MVATIAEVWGRYKNQILEIWFDGGENNIALNNLIAELQPQAIATDGTQGPNYARLVGQESGFAPYPVWSTTTGPAQDGSGTPGGGYFVPAEADTPVSEEDAWFWKPNVKYRPIDELKAVYRNTVGSNSVLELGVLPDNTGSIPADQMAVLQAFGDYIRSCHSPSAAIAATNGTGSSITLTLPNTTIINRVILQEDLTFGELVLSFTVEVQPPGGYNPKPVPVAQGLSIGHKRILYFASGPIPASSVIVTATSIYPGYSSVNWRNVAAYAPCAGDM